MERDEAVIHLPIAYQRVLGLLDEGLSTAEIAARLGIDPHAVDPLIDLAEAKLARLVASTPVSTPPGPITEAEER